MNVQQLMQGWIKRFANHKSNINFRESILPGFTSLISLIKKKILENIMLQRYKRQQYL